MLQERIAWPFERAGGPRAQAPSHGPDADVVVDRHRRPGVGRTPIDWADRPPIVGPPKRSGSGGRQQEVSLGPIDGRPGPSRKGCTT